MKINIDGEKRKAAEPMGSSKKASEARVDSSGARLDAYGQSGFKSVKIYVDGGGKSTVDFSKKNSNTSGGNKGSYAQSEFKTVAFNNEQQVNGQNSGQSNRQNTNQHQKPVYQPPEKKDWKQWMPWVAMAAAFVLVFCITAGGGKETGAGPGVSNGGYSNGGSSNTGHGNNGSGNSDYSNGGSGSSGYNNGSSDSGGSNNGGSGDNGYNSGAGNSFSDTAWRNNVMSSSGLDAFQRDRTRILSVAFYDTLAYAPTNPDEIYYLGTNASQRVQGWIEYEGKYIHLYIAAEGGVNVKLCAEGFFEGCEKLEVINFNGAFHTEEATSMRNMFNGCSSLYFADFANLDTSNVTDMYQMFRDCSSLTAMDVYGFDTSKVTNMSCMFSTCTKLTELDLSNFDTSNVTNMSYMFSACKSIKEINTSSFNTSKVTNMTHMFRWCDMLDTLYLGGWDFSHVTKYNKFMNDGITVNGRPWEELFV